MILYACDDQESVQLLQSQGGLSNPKVCGMTPGKLNLKLNFNFNFVLLLKPVGT